MRPAVSACPAHLLSAMVQGYIAHKETLCDGTGASLIRKHFAMVQGYLAHKKTLPPDVCAGSADTTQTRLKTQKLSKKRLAGRSEPGNPKPETRNPEPETRNPAS